MMVENPSPEPEKDKVVRITSTAPQVQGQDATESGRKAALGDVLVAARAESSVGEGTTSPSNPCDESGIAKGQRQLAERMNDLIQKIRARAAIMHKEDGGYDRTAEDIRKMLIAFDRGE